MGIGLVVAAVGTIGGWAVATDAAYLVGLVAVTGGLYYAQPAFKRLLVPSPFDADWRLYAPLGRALDWESGGQGGGSVERWLSLGTGTGRSLVALRESVPDGCRVLAVDAFGRRTVRGGAADLARRNARTAGLTAAVVRGSGSQLPVTPDSQDVATLDRCLPATDADTVLREVRRVVRSGGQVGVVQRADDDGRTADEWEAFLEDRGFTVTDSGRVRRSGTSFWYLCCRVDE